MLPIILVTLFGAVIGWKIKLPTSWDMAVHRAGRGFLLLMLFSLGVHLGASTDIFVQLPTIGIQALLISLFAISGSILATVLLAPFLRAQPNIADSSKEPPLPKT